MGDKETYLIKYGQHCLGDTVESPAGVSFNQYEDIFRQGVVKLNSLESILSLISLQTDKRIDETIASYYSYRPTDLTDDNLIFPSTVKMPPKPASIDIEELGSFAPHQSQTHAGAFEQFFHLMKKHGWTLPGRFGIPGISLFEEWKAVCALVFACGANWEKGPAERYTLVGGDIPGIQDFVYTISSKGAAKGLRGRSFFIQLFIDSLIERLLLELNLSRANIIYSAAGNFMLLAPADIGENLNKIKNNVEKALLSDFHGDLSLCLDQQEIPVAALAGKGYGEFTKQLKEKIASQKQRRFAGIIQDHWGDLFAPHGAPGNRSCVVCQTPLEKGVGKVLEIMPGGEISYTCNSCEGFRLLANRLARKDLAIRMSAKQGSNKGEPWQEFLWHACAIWTTIDEFRKIAPGADGITWLINDTDFLNKGAHGFRLLANATPVVCDFDIARWEEENAKGTAEDEAPEKGDIRNFSQLAEAADGVRQVGVLRMDVDNLGSIVTRGIPNNSLLIASALSFMLDLFFGGWLNKICADINGVDRIVNGEDRGERLYTIYAGGDDLFIVGSWNLLPVLAERIREDFRRFGCGNPDLSISGGMTLEGRKFPLYQAATRCGEVEKSAKNYRRNGKEKDAFHFLNLPIGWEEWSQVTTRRARVEEAMADNAPKALLRVLQDAYQGYVRKNEESSRKNKDSPGVEFGPWIWRGAYMLARMADRAGADHQEAARIMRDFQLDLMARDRLRYSALAARWVELLNRNQEEVK
jgi:CRISPR-associated protein Csm1